MDDFRKLIYGVIAAFVALVVVWVGFLYISACGFTFTCRRGQPAFDATPIPTLAAATLPPPDFSISIVPSATLAAGTAVPGGDQVPRPSNPGGPGEAVNLTGDAEAGAQVFQTSCTPCHGAEGKQGLPDPGAEAGAVPALNPIDPALASPDYKTFATNLDLFIQHGSTPQGSNPSMVMPAWGETGALTQQQIADVIAYIIELNQ